jgi:hypothetical protein
LHKAFISIKYGRDAVREIFSEQEISYKKINKGKDCKSFSLLILLIIIGTSLLKNQENK